MYSVLYPLPTGKGNYALYDDIHMYMYMYIVDTV